MRGKFLTWLTVFTVVASSLPLTITKAFGALNAKVDAPGVQVISSGDKEINFDFTVFAIYDGFFNDSDAKEQRAGSAKANFVSEKSNLTFSYGIPSGIVNATAKTVRVFKIDKASFTPLTVKDPADGTTTINNNNLWDSVVVVYIDRSASNYTEEGNIGTPNRSPAIYFFTTKADGSPDNWYHGNTLARSVQESMAASLFAIPVTSGGTLDHGGTIGLTEAQGLIAAYTLDVKLDTADAQDFKNDPPFITLPSKNSGEGKPQDLLFRFSALMQSHGSAALDNYFFWFRSIIYSNLWLVVDQESDTLIAVTDVPKSTIAEEVIINGSFSNSSLLVNAERFDEKITHRVFNECENSDTGCSAGVFTKFINQPGASSKFSVGPGGTSPYNDAAATKKNKKVPSTCADKEGDVTAGSGKANCNEHSWMDTWNKKNGGIHYGVTVSDISILGGDCGFGKLFGLFATAGFGEVFAEMTSCLVKEIFTPAVEWAAELVVKAAGITHYQPEPWNRWRA